MKNKGVGGKGGQRKRGKKKRVLGICSWPN